MFREQIPPQHSSTSLLLRRLLSLAFANMDIDFLAYYNVSSQRINHQSNWLFSQHGKSTSPRLTAQRGFSVLTASQAPNSNLNNARLKNIRKNDEE
jgi:hypothetical protein